MDLPDKSAGEVAANRGEHDIRAQLIAFLDEFEALGGDGTVTAGEIWSFIARWRLLAKGFRAYLKASAAPEPLVHVGEIWCVQLRSSQHGELGMWKIGHLTDRIVGLYRDPLFIHGAEQQYQLWRLDEVEFVEKWLAPASAEGVSS